jgi:dCTP deaminase
MAPESLRSIVRLVILSDRSIKEHMAAGSIIVEPLADKAIQPSSVDVRISSLYRTFRNHTQRVIDVKEDQAGLTELVDVGPTEPFILHPGEFVLGSTVERVALPNDLVARIEGKSSLGRLGLVIHATAGFIDAGWDGHITLELSNVATLPITLYTGMKIGQISFFQMTTPADNPYGTSALGSKYRGQVGPTPSQYFRNFE